MRIACWIRKATNTHLEYVIFIATPQQLWFHESASILRYTYIACLVFFILGLFNEAFKLLRYLIFSTLEIPDRLWGPRSAGFLSRGYSGRGVKLTTHLRLVPMSRMSGATPVPPTSSCFRCTESPSVHFGRD